MSFDLKTTVQPDLELTPQQKKLNRLIDKIEQQKCELEQWQQAKEEIQQYTRKTFVPVYDALYVVLFEQMQQLWNSLSQYNFSKADMAQLEDKIYVLAGMLKELPALNQQQHKKVDELYHYFQQSVEYAQTKKSKNKASSEVAESFNELNDSDQIDSEVYKELDAEQYSQAREQARFKRQQEKREQAEKMAEQSLKTVYLKIAATIHPDREPDEAKKIEKTEMLQRANEAYAEQDLFSLLKMQIQVEQNRDSSKKGLTAEQVKFYQLALNAQSHKLQDQIDELIADLVWSQKAKITIQKSKGKVQITDLYKQIDADTAAVKQQLKVEKERLKYMKKVSGLEMLLENGVL
ncbi:molecular chaperone DnaJ [Acinetobacter sp. LoGeW2-3]|uniref:molecular chaperone DnaJ n=1 Tax=Acinetobacter sp. LoGeW2-3 TaxID=1808001 RepID=UPI000C0592A3|nr:molecular chaperone DnaJ [Acinetobacter sp. LoGeW2-3]ATO18351.1 molecular chaperone DnaJ [Acinetobacter sp. LoGeW2-3]